MFLIKLALRNLGRHRRRTLLTAVVISFVVVFFVYSDSLVKGMMEAAYENITDFDFGHVQITHPENWEEREEYSLKNLMIADKELQDAIKSVAGVENIVPRIDFKANLNDGWDELPVIGRGIIPEKEKEAFKLEEAIVEGTFLKTGEYQAVIGKELAQDMALEIGSNIVLLVRTIDESFNVIDLEICGLLQTSNPHINKNIVFVSLEAVQQALNIGDSISHLAVKLTDRKMSGESAVLLSDVLSRENTEYRAYPWESGAEELIVMQEYSDNSIILVLGVFLLLAALGIINNLILSILERTNEIGMIKAMGFRETEIILLFALEGVGIGIIGSILGCFLGALAVGFLNTYGINIYAGIAGEIDLPLSLARVYGEWNPGAFIFVFLYITVISFLVGLLPAWWGARKNPAEAIKQH